MKNTLKHICKDYGVCAVLIVAFIALCYYKVPMIISTKLSSVVVSLLEKHGVDVHKTITPNEYLTFLVVITAVIIVAALVFGTSTDDKECEE